MNASCNKTNDKAIPRKTKQVEKSEIEIQETQMKGQNEPL